MNDRLDNDFPAPNTHDGGAGQGQHDGARRAPWDGDGDASQRRRWRSRGQRGGEQRRPNRRPWDRGLSTHRLRTLRLHIALCTSGTSGRRVYNGRRGDTLHSVWQLPKMATPQWKIAGFLPFVRCPGPRNRGLTRGTKDAQDVLTLPKKRWSGHRTMHTHTLDLHTGPRVPVT